MSPIHKISLEDKLFRLNENVKFIEDILKKGDKEISLDTPIYYGLEHLLHLSIEIIIDIGSHILAESFAENPKTYRDVIISLGVRGVVDVKFAEEQAEMAKFRNFLVHGYDNVDRQKVITYAKSAPKIFREFGKNFLTFISKEN